MSEKNKRRCGDMAGAPPRATGTDSPTTSTSPETVECSEDDEDERSDSTSVRIVISEYDVPGPSCPPGSNQTDTKRRDSHSSDSSTENVPILDRIKLSDSLKALQSPSKKRRISVAEQRDKRQSSVSGEGVVDEENDPVLSNIEYKISTPVGDYVFYGPRREFTVVDLKKSITFDEPFSFSQDLISPEYLPLLELPQDSFFVKEFSSKFLKRDEAAYKNHALNYLFYLSEEKNRIFNSDEDTLDPHPHDIENGMQKALTAAVDTIKDSLIFRTRAEQDNVFNNEFYISLVEDGYKPGFSNTNMYQQKDLSEGLWRMALLLLALADSAMNNIRLVAGIGYCFAAHAVITTFRKLSLLDQTYKVIDHVIRQKVSAAVHAIEFYTDNGSGVIQKPFQQVCNCFGGILFTTRIMTCDRNEWEILESVEEREVTTTDFLKFTGAMINPYVHWTIDEYLAWTTDVTTSVRAARKMAVIIENFRHSEKIKSEDLNKLLILYKNIGAFEIDVEDRENKRVEALLSIYRGLSLAPLLECFENPKQVDDLACQVAGDITIAIEAERASPWMNRDLIKQMLEDQMIFALLRLLYHMWEVHKPKDVTRIRLKLLGIRQAAERSYCEQLRDNGRFPAIIALSSILYLDYSCGMISKANGSTIKKTRKECERLAEDHLAGDDECRDQCLSIITLKMDEIQQTIFNVGENRAKSNFERGYRILKTALLAYPVLLFHAARPEILSEMGSNCEKPNLGCYKRKPRNERPRVNGQKIFYHCIPYAIDRRLRKQKFLKLEEETYVDAIEKRRKHTLPTASEESEESDSDTDDDADHIVNVVLSSERGNDRLFLLNWMQFSSGKATGYSPNAELLLNEPTRDTMAAALDKYTRTKEAHNMMLDPLRTVSPTLSEDSASRPESRQSRQSRPESRTGSDVSSNRSSLRSDKGTKNITFENIKAFRPVDLEGFYKEITIGNLYYPLSPPAFESSMLHAILNKTLTKKSPSDAEGKFKKSIRIVLESLRVSVEKLSSRCRKFELVKRHYWRKWRRRIALFIQQLEGHRPPRYYSDLLGLLHEWSLVLGFPSKIYYLPNSCPT